MALIPGNGGLVGLPTDASAYSMDRLTPIMAYTLWSDATDDEAKRKWIRHVSSTLEPIRNGNFVSEADHEDHPQRLAATFSPEHWSRLGQLCEVWDPERRFLRPGQPQVS